MRPKPSGRALLPLDAFGLTAADHHRGQIPISDAACQPPPARSRERRSKSLHYPSVLGGIGDGRTPAAVVDNLELEGDGPSGAGCAPAGCGPSSPTGSSIGRHEDGREDGREDGNPIAGCCASQDEAIGARITDASAAGRRDGAPGIAVHIRRELALISSSQNIVGECAPRRCHVVLPWCYEAPDSPCAAARTGVRTDEGSPQLDGGDATSAAVASVASQFGARGAPRAHGPLSEDETLASLVREPTELMRAVRVAEGRGGAQSIGGRNGGGLLHLCTKEATLDPQTGARTLHFGGRVRCSSVKNFQMELLEGGDGATTVLGADGARPLVCQFGKRARDEFILDFRHPLSPIQAFALGLTALARKLSSEGG